MQIADFNCDIGVLRGITPELLEQAGSSFPACYLSAQEMAKTSLALKRTVQACFCALPFCHTLEAEATGGEVLFDDVTIGARSGQPVLKKLDQLEALPPLDLTQGRIAETLQACLILRAQGEEVLFSLTGPITWLNVLCGTGPIFKGLRKEPARMQQIFADLLEQLVRLAKAAVDAGATMIGYSDSVAGLNVMGPQNMAMLAERFTKPLLQRLLAELGDRAIILLCPKQSFALIGTELAQWRELPTGQDVPYVQACLAAKEGRIFGQTCAKHHQVRVNGMIRTLVLK